jgi:hypothetical protein
LTAKLIADHDEPFRNRWQSIKPGLPEKGSK